MVASSEDTLSTDPVRGDSRTRLVVQTMAVVVVLFTAYSVLPLRGRGVVFGAMGGLAMMLAVIPVLARRVRGVLQSDHPVADALAAVAIAATLLIVGPATAYCVIVAADPGSFAGLETRIDAVYFSVTVLSTVGFGDITPVSQAARLITTLHILVVLALLGAAVRLVTWAARRRIGDVDP